MVVDLRGGAWLPWLGSGLGFLVALGELRGEHRACNRGPRAPERNPLRVSKKQVRDSESSFPLHRTAMPAFGREGIALLVRTLAPDPHLLNTLLDMIASPNAKAEAILAKPPIMPTLLTFLHPIDVQQHSLRKTAANIIAQLCKTYQGRQEASNANAVQILQSTITSDPSPEVAAAAAQALFEISRSRDGCILINQHRPLVAQLTLALEPSSHSLVAEPCLATLANLMQRDLGIADALTAGIIPKLRDFATPGNASQTEQLSSLHTLWNICNTPPGKEASVEAGMLELFGKICVEGSNEAKRLSAGCIMAITVVESGKRGSGMCLEPLIELALDPSSDAATVRNAVSALKNAAELPKARKIIEGLACKRGLNAQSMFSDRGMGTPAFDADCWPDSKRYMSYRSTNEVAYLRENRELS